MSITLIPNNESIIRREDYRPTLLVNIRCKIPFKNGKCNPAIRKIQIKSQLSSYYSRNAKST